MHCWQTPQSVPTATLLELQAPAPSQVSGPEQAVEALLPQALPTALLAPSRQTDDPVVQDVIPDLHAVGLVVHARPAVHDVQVPVLQTRLVPQVAPLASDVPLSVQTGDPVEHESVPL